MSKYTMTIYQILKSMYPDYKAFMTKEDFNEGDFLSPHELIEETKDTFFNRMSLNKYVNNDFKTQFLLRFYNSEIGFETVTPFFTRLETILNNDCLIQLKLADDLRNKAIDDLINQNDLTNTSKSTGKNSSLGLGESTPETDKKIVFDEDNFSLIRYADQIQEGYNKNQADGESNMKGYSGTTPYYLLAQSLTSLTDVYIQIFNICDSRLFMNIY